MHQLLFGKFTQTQKRSNVWCFHWSPNPDEWQGHVNLPKCFLWKWKTTANGDDMGKSWVNGACSRAVDDRMTYLHFFSAVLSVYFIYLPSVKGNSDEGLIGYNRKFHEKSLRVGFVRGHTPQCTESQSGLWCWSSRFQKFDLNSWFANKIRHLVWDWHPIWGWRSWRWTLHTCQTKRIV